MDSFVKSVADFLNNKIDFLDAGKYSPAVYIAAAGVLGLLIVFFIALLGKNGSKLTKLRKKLQDTTAYVNAMRIIDENNVELLYDKIRMMSRPVNVGWTAFMTQQTGYPSDYITEKECLDERKSGVGFRPAKGFFVIASILVLCVCVALANIACFEMLSDLSLQSATAVTLAVLGAVCIPLLFFIVFLAILGGSYKKAYRKLSAAFQAFQDALDSSVVIFREELDEFVSENIEEINSTIEEILANKLNNTEVIELVTTPRIEEEEVPAEPVVPLVAPAPAPSPAPAPAPSPAPAPAPAPVKDAVIETAAAAVVSEEVAKGNRLIQLVYIVEAAVSDAASTASDIDDLAQLIYAYMTNGDYTTPDEREILAECLTILAQYK